MTPAGPALCSEQQHQNLRHHDLDHHRDGRRERIAESELIVIDSLSTDGTTEILRANLDIIDRLLVALRLA